MTSIEQLVKNKEYKKAIEESMNQNLYDIALLLSKVTKTNDYDDDIIPNIKDIPKHFVNKNNQIRIFVCCSWTSSEDLLKAWKNMSKNTNYSWNNIQIVSSEPCDYYCVINRPPPTVSIDKKRTILFRMEPYMEKDERQWSEWSNPNKDDFLYFGSHEYYLNNFEWHLSKSYTQLMNEEIIKNESLSNVLSTILSDKYNDPGHMKRVDFVKFLENKGMNVDVFGGNRFLWKNYKGSLPMRKKDDSLFPYKYSFNVENHSIKNYCTEKLVDGILAETLVFYSGCYNIKEYIDENAFVYLELTNFENDYQIIKKAIEEDLWSQKLPYIKEAKKKILNELQFYPRLEKIINERK